MKNRTAMPIAAAWRAVRWALIALTLACACVLALPAGQAHAGKGDLDEIVDYSITVDVNDDATLSMAYHVEWKVLDSTSEGPLTWVRIGIPNRHCSMLTSTSPTVKDIWYSATDGDYARISLDRAYHAGEVVSFDFTLEQDYMYQVNRDNDGETVYEFTPGWFDDIEVDQLTVKWNADKVSRFAPACQREGGYLTWRTALDDGQRYTVTVAYPNDAYAFDISKEIVTTESENEESDDPITLFFTVIAAIVFMIAIPVAVIAYIASLIRRVVSFFRKDSGFKTSKRITRTKVVYYPTCPSCGARREEGKETCTYCGGSFIKSEEVVQVKDLPPEEGAIKRKRSAGLYPFSSAPDTYLRVQVTHIVTSPSRTSSSCASSSCASSSCACACGCACACACAGGGRAGCTAKDFYNTDLKLRQLADRR